MSVAVVVVCSLLIWLAVSPLAALVIGRAIRLADQRSTPIPPAGVRSGEEAQPSPGRHLHLV